MIFCFSLLISCTDRERLNPFDPGNPETGGAPSGVLLSSNHKVVSLCWDPVEINDLLGYVVYRTTDSPIDTIDFQITTGDVCFNDLNTEYDSTYFYSLQTLTKHDSSRRSTPVGITPGPVNIWLTDYYAATVKRMTYDGAHTLGAAELNSPIAVCVDTIYNRAIVADYWDQRLYKLDMDLQILLHSTLSYRPVDLDIDLSSGTIYVLLETDIGIINVIDPTGLLIESISFPRVLSNRSSLIYDNISKSIWVNNFDTVYQYQLQEQDHFITHSAIQGTRAIASDPISGGCWVGGDSGIVKISPNGEIDTVKWSFIPYAIDCDPTNGDCYYTGYDYYSQSWQTGRINGSSPSIDSQILGNEYPDLYGIKVIPGIGSSGFIANQVRTWKLLRFTADGELIGELNDFNNGLDFALE